MTPSDDATGPGGDPSPAARPTGCGILAARCIVLAVVAWGIHRAAGRAIADLQQQDFSLRSVSPGWLAAAVGLYLAGLLPSAFFWHRVMQGMGQRPRLGETIRAYYIGHLGKYVPGKVMVVALRVSLVRGVLVSGPVAAVGIVYETLTMMAAGSTLAALILVIWTPERAWLAAAALAMAAVIGAPTLPAFVRQASNLASNRFAMIERLGLAPLDYATLARGWLWMSIGWLGSGASLWSVLRAAGYTRAGATWEELALATAAAALGVVAGFVSMIPGGLVVREAVVLGLLAEGFGHGGALVAAVLSRLVWLVAEVLVSSILYVGGRWTRERAPD